METYFAERILLGSNPFRRHRRSDVAESRHCYAPLPWSRVSADIAGNFGSPGLAAATRPRDPEFQSRYWTLDFPPRGRPDKISRPPADSSISVTTSIHRPGNGISIACDISQEDDLESVTLSALKYAISYMHLVSSMVCVK